jgi:hypothetical protein
LVDGLAFAPVLAGEALTFVAGDAFVMGELPGEAFVAGDVPGDAALEASVE